MIIELILFVVIAIFFIYMIKQVDDNTIFEKTYVSRDMALMANTVQSVPGDVTVYYSQPNFDIGNFSYDLSNNLVTLYDPGKRLGTEVRYPFFLNSKLLSALGVLETPYHLVFVKNNGVFQIRVDYDQDSVEQAICSNIKAELAGKNTLVVYSVSEASSGNENNNAQKIITYLTSDKISFIKRSENKDEITINTNLILVIKINSDQSSTKNIIKAYYPYGQNSEQSKTMACLILDSITTEFSEPGVEVILGPIQSPDANINKNRNGMAVLLELGNDMVKDNPLFRDTNALSVAIHNGINAYYNEVEEVE